ncbi:ParB N-terminal domain-containing protein [Rhizobium azibense]|uniref:ParB-like nuclease family protein n=1 Tax=Rhizobium azibense TaxID=1136135 RepID=A0A4R3RXV9_9HYPH|nr:ParB N-terminal domain-containing protein [Rhizobium azibense]TCU41158.1 ParB-like nuclease family protein [Rhizobium azibense]
MKFNLLPPNKLIPTEETDSRRVDEVHGLISTAGCWTVPIMVEKDALFVMDGHHRLEVALRLQLRAVPVILLDYSSVRVEAWRADETIAPADVYDMARSRRKFPIKTTRHIVLDDLPACDVSLDDLRQWYEPLGGSERLAG